MDLETLKGVKGYKDILKYDDQEHLQITLELSACGHRQLMLPDDEMKKAEAMFDSQGVKFDYGITSVAASVDFVPFLHDQTAMMNFVVSFGIGFTAGKIIDQISKFLHDRLKNTKVAVRDAKETKYSMPPYDFETLYKLVEDAVERQLKEKGQHGNMGQDQDKEQGQDKKRKTDGNA